MSKPNRVGARSRRRGSGTLASLALLGTALALCVLASELILGFLYPSEPVFIREHPQFGFFNIPGKSGWWIRETEAPVWVEINSKGLRDFERGYEKPDGVARVMMLGDSFIGAFNVPFEEMASRRLETKLREATGTDRIEVINAGVQGYGTAQELLFLREEGFRYEPDIVVLNFFAGNDFGNNDADVAAPTKPRFSVEDGELRFHPPRQVEAVRWFRDGLFTKSATVRTIRRSGLFELAGMGRTMARIGLVSSDGGHRLDDATITRLGAVTCLLVERMDIEIAERGALLYVHVIPGGIDLFEFYPAEVRPHTNPPRFLTEARRRMTEDLLRCLAERDIPVIFDWEGIVEEARRGQLVFVEGIGHWNREGNERAAEDVKEAILPDVRAALRASR